MSTANAFSVIVSCGRIVAPFPDADTNSIGKENPGHGHAGHSLPYRPTMLWLWGFQGHGEGYGTEFPIKGLHSIRHFPAENQRLTAFDCVLHLLHRS